MLLKYLIGVVATLFAVATSAVITPISLHDIIPTSGQTSGRLIIQLKEGVAIAHTINNLTGIPGVNITHKFDTANTFGGFFSHDAITVLRASPSVVSIAQSGVTHVILPDSNQTIVKGPTYEFKSVNETVPGVTQTDARWGLSRLSTMKIEHWNYQAENFKYTYTPTAGAGVNIYVVDSGVQITHNEFKEDRARWGATFGGYSSVDDMGHGTYAAGIAAGSKYGVAKNANIVAVKVGSKERLEELDVISGLYWVKDDVARNGRPSVVSVSASFLSPGDAMDKAVNSLTDAGIHIIVAAGNYGQDASAWTPARVRSAITVGSSTIFDTRAVTSNYGPAVDLFAPGEYVISAWVGDSNAETKWSSGTSAATPHVSGLVALLIAAEGNMTPAMMSNKLKAYALSNVVGNIFPFPHTDNLLAHIFVH